MIKIKLSSVAMSMILGTFAQQTPVSSPALLRSEFIYERAPFPSAHASTIVETRSGLVAAWFGGTKERDPDVGIWVSRHDGSQWTTPVEVANGVQPDGKRLPCWNPVLFQPTNGPLVLFYKVGPSPDTWWGLARTSSDEGRTWSPAIKLPDGILGPIRAKPIELSKGTMLAGSSTEHDGWIVHMERYTGDWSAQSLAAAASWQKTEPLNTKADFGAIQPAILVHSPTSLQILCRSRQSVIAESWSQDGGRTWSPMKATTLPNPSAGIDAVRLADGRFLLIYNPTATGRAKLDIAVSHDGKGWKRAVVLEDSSGEYSYPAIIQARDGRIHATYTWRREKIKHVVIDPKLLEGK